MAAPALAQDDTGVATRIVEHEVTRGDDYARATRLTRVQTDIRYVEEANGTIPMDGPIPDPPDQRQDFDFVPPGDAVELLTRIVLVIGVVFLLVLIFRNRHFLTNRFGGAEPKKRGVTAQPGQTPVLDVDHPGLLAELRAMEDRAAALERLASAVMDVAAHANGLRLGASETARDLLGRLPQSWTHWAGLRRIVMAQELVRFGGRPLAETTFEACLDAADPILRLERGAS
ncbi:MAG: DUF4129 domain-containing protein [Pseudomonadota bacterium]